MAEQYNRRPRRPRATSKGTPHPHPPPPLKLKRRPSYAWDRCGACACVNRRRGAARGHAVRLQCVHVARMCVCVFQCVKARARVRARARRVAKRTARNEAATRRTAAHLATSRRGFVSTATVLLSSPRPLPEILPGRPVAQLWPGRRNVRPARPKMIKTNFANASDLSDL